jgi:hypothetical protein
MNDQHEYILIRDTSKEPTPYAEPDSSLHRFLSTTTRKVVGFERYILDGAPKWAIKVMR